MNGPHTIMVGAPLLPEGMTLVGTVEPGEEPSILAGTMHDDARAILAQVEAGELLARRSTEVVEGVGVVDFVDLAPAAHASASHFGGPDPAHAVGLAERIDLLEKCALAGGTRGAIESCAEDARQCLGALIRDVERTTGPAVSPDAVALAEVLARAAEKVYDLAEAVVDLRQDYDAGAEAADAAEEEPDGGPYPAHAVALGELINEMEGAALTGDGAKGLECAGRARIRLGLFIADVVRAADHVDELAGAIIRTCPGEPSRSEGAVQCAIRLLEEQAEAERALREECERPWRMNTNGAIEPGQQLFDGHGNTFLFDPDMAGGLVNFRDPATKVPPPADPDAVVHAARNLYDNRLADDGERRPYAPREFWNQLGRALYGEGHQVATDEVATDEVAEPPDRYVADNDGD